MICTSLLMNDSDQAALNYAHSHCICWGKCDKVDRIIPLCRMSVYWITEMFIESLMHMFNELSLKVLQLLRLWTKLIILSFTTVIQCNISIFSQEIFLINWIVRVSINEIIEVVHDALDSLSLL